MLLLVVMLRLVEPAPVPVPDTSLCATDTQCEL